MDASASPGRFRSRYLREMNAQRENPFHSPPSSTGSHGTVSPTRTSMFSGESTRRLNAEIDRAMAPAKFEVNWDAVHRKWPEFYSAPDRRTKALAAPVPDTSISVNLATLDRHAENLRAALAAANIHDSQDEDEDDDDESTRDVTWMGSNRTRAEMQPRVENDGDASSMLVRSPMHRLAGMSALQQQQQQQQESRRRSSLSKMQMAPARSASDPQIRQVRASLPALNAATPAKSKMDNNILLTTASLNRLNAFSPAANLASPGHNLTANLTSRSFMMPDISHLGEFISGSLQYKGNNSNGVPVFVKNGRVHDRNDQPEHHAEVDAMEIPGDEDNIFVSMDQIREQIVGLQEHDDMMQQYADSLEHEVERLKTEVLELKYTRANDSGLGSSDGDHGVHGVNGANDRLAADNARLENQVRTLQARLDDTSHKASASEANTVHLSQEHGRSLKRLEAACAEMNELVEKLDSTQKRLTATEQELETSQQLNLNRNGNGNGNGNSHEVAALKRELESLKKENKRLNTEIRALRSELHTLRTDEDMTRKNHERLMAENQSLRATNRNLMKETDDLRTDNMTSNHTHTTKDMERLPIDVQSLRTSNRALMKEAEELRASLSLSTEDLAAARQDIVVLQQDVAKMETEQHTLREDNESLVRHNDKYFTENKILRKENSSFERTLHELHDDNLRLKDEVDFLKSQLDHCRPMGKEADLTGAAEELEEGMTSGFFVPDATISNEVDVSEHGPARETTAHSTRQMRDATDHSTRNLTVQSEPSSVAPGPSRQAGKQRAAPRGGNTSQKVAFSIPNDGGTPARPANVGSKRRSVSGNGATNSARKVTKGSAATELEPPVDDTTGRPSPEYTQQLDNTTRSRKDGKAVREPTITREITNTQQSHKNAVPSTSTSRRTSSRPKDRNAELTRESAAACPALSPSARRVLDNLCEHNCRNCTVCARISSHRSSTRTPAELASGKKRIVVSRPIPVTERDVTSSTIRPANDPGHALALVIKGLTDERDHINMHLTKLQDQYKTADPSVGRRARTSLAEQIRQAMASAETKGDQIYHLNDVVVGLGRQGGAMNEDEVELTVFSITGAHVAEWMDQLAC